MSKATYDTGGMTGAFSLSNMNDQFDSLYQGDSSALRPVAQSTPDMTIAVGAALVESYFQQIWTGRTPLSYAGGNSSAISAPTSNPRIDLLYINNDNTLAWITGTEAGSPTAPAFTGNGIPICYVYCQTTMTNIVNYADRAAYPTQGYIYRDVRPVYTRSLKWNTLFWFLPSNLAIGTEKSGRIYVPFAGTIKQAYIYSKTAPTGASIIVDINKNGTTLWTTQANRVSIAASSNTGSQTSFNTTTFAVGDYFTFDLDQVGSGTVGSDLSVHLYIQS